MLLDISHWTSESKAKNRTNGKRLHSKNFSNRLLFGLLMVSDSLFLSLGNDYLIAVAEFITVIQFIARITWQSLPCL